MDSTLQLVMTAVLGNLDSLCIFTNGWKFGYRIGTEIYGLLRNTECVYATDRDALKAGLLDYEGLKAPGAIGQALSTLTVKDDMSAGTGTGTTPPYQAPVTFVYTGAPEGADYSTTIHLETFEAAACPGATPKTWRKVAIVNDTYRTAYQCDRYCSFLGGCPTLDDPRTHPIGTGRNPPSNMYR